MEKLMPLVFSVVMVSIGFFLIMGSLTLTGFAVYESESGTHGSVLGLILVALGIFAISATFWQKKR